MTATTLAPAVPSAARLTFGGILRSEWIKLTSLRSTVWSYVLIVLLSVGFGLLMASTFNPGVDETGAAVELDAASARSITLMICTAGLMVGQLIAAVLGVLVISGEYSTGMIKSTLAAVPARLPVLWAKAIVLFVSTTVVGLVTVFLVFAVTAPVRLERGIDASLGDPALLLALVGGAVYLGLVAVFALGVGAVVRSSAGGIAVALGVMLVLPVLVQMLGNIAEWARDIMPNLLSSAGQAMFSIPQELPPGVEVGPGSPLSPGIATLVVLAWAVVALVLGAVALRRRDA